MGQRYRALHAYEHVHVCDVTLSRRIERLVVIVGFPYKRKTVLLQKMKQTGYMEDDLPA